MTGNKIGNKGGMCFAAMIQVNTTVQKLDLADCDLVSKNQANYVTSSRERDDHDFMPGCQLDL